jgi:hypothetical protein
MAVIHDARGQVLDDLTQMLLRLVRKIEWKSDQRLAQWHQTRRSKTDVLIRAFHDSLVVHGAKLGAVEKVSQVETVFAAQGGREALAQSCEEHLRYERQNWRPFARAVFVPLRSALLRLVGILPMQGTATAAGLLSLVRSLTNEASPRCDYQTIDGVAPNTLPREWHDLVHDHAGDKQAFNRRQLEVVAIDSDQGRRNIHQWLPELRQVLGSPAKRSCGPWHYRGVCHRARMGRWCRRTRSCGEKGA